MSRKGLLTGLGLAGVAAIALSSWTSHCIAAELQPRAERPFVLGPDASEMNLLRTCEDPQCGLGEDGDACTACQIYQRALIDVPEAAIQYAGGILENGVSLRVTSSDPETRDLLWRVSAARNQILELVHHGTVVPLCDACSANVRSFEALKITLRRIPNGVFLAYTSERPDLVRFLQAMVVGASELPL